MIKKNVEQFNMDVKNNGVYIYNSGFSGYITRQKIVNTWKDIYNFEGKRVLDLGCGDGTFSLELHKIIGNKGLLLGIDPSTEAINSINSRVCNIAMGGGMKFEVGNIYDLRLKDKFDCITLTGVLHHLPDPKEAILKIAHLSDTIVCMEPNGYNPALKVLEKVSKYHIEHEEQSFTFITLNKWFNEAGFKITKKKYIDVVPMMCSDFIAKTLNFFNPFFENIPLLNKISCGRIIFKAEK